MRRILAAAADFASQARVVLIRADNGVPIDVSLGALPYEQRLVARSNAYEFAPKVVLRTCSAEDLVVLKVFAGRPRDWSDVEGIVTRQGPNSTVPSCAPSSGRCWSSRSPSRIWGGSTICSSGPD